MTDVQLPQGHRHRFTFNGFVYCEDADGHEYVKGCYSEQLPGGERVLTQTQGGVRKQWHISPSGVQSPIKDADEEAASAIPAGQRGISWGGVRRDPTGHRVERRCEEWGRSIGTAGQTPWLWVCGPRGTGKSSIASLIVRDAIQRGRSCKSVDWAEFLRGIKAGFKAGTSEALIDAACSVDLLVLDDVGKDQPSEWAGQVLFEVVNGRERRGLPTMATSNYPPKDACLRYGEDKGLAIADRIGGSSVAVLAGKSFREEVARKN